MDEEEVEKGRAERRARRSWASRSAVRRLVRSSASMGLSREVLLLCRTVVLEMRGADARDSRGFGVVHNNYLARLL